MLHTDQTIFSRNSIVNGIFLRKCLLYMGCHWPGYSYLVINETRVKRIGVDRDHCGQIFCQHPLRLISRRWEVEGSGHQDQPNLGLIRVPGRNSSSRD